MPNFTPLSLNTLGNGVRNISLRTYIYYLLIWPYAVIPCTIHRVILPVLSSGGICGCVASSKKHRRNMVAHWCS